LTTIAQMTDSEAVMTLLRKVPLFANLKDEDKVCIEETEEWRLPAGEMLVEEGEHAALGGGAGRLIAARCHELRANQSTKDPKSALRFSRSKDRCQDRNPSATSVPVMQRNPYTLSVSCFREKRVRPPEGQDSARHEKLRGGHPGA
jgi:hypothetical protein